MGGFYHFRLILFRLIMKKAGVKEGCMAPWWTYVVRFSLFPIQALHIWADKSGPVVLNISRDTVTICGVEYSMVLFETLAIPKPDILYRFKRVGPGVGVITIKEFHLGSGWVYIEKE